MGTKLGFVKNVFIVIVYNSWKLPLTCQNIPEPLEKRVKTEYVPRKNLCILKPSYLLWIMLRLYMNLSLENHSVLRHSEVLWSFHMHHTLFLMPFEVSKKSCIAHQFTMFFSFYRYLFINDTNSRRPPAHAHVIHLALILIHGQHSKQRAAAEPASESKQPAVLSHSPSMQQYG